MESITAGVERLAPLPFELVRKELQQIEDMLLRETWSSVGMVRDISHHILGAGGKRIRPALLLTTARAVGRADEWSLKLAICVELLHTATLMHDDVVDHSDWRRGRITAHRQWGQSASILTGDVMFAKAMRILVDYGDLAVLDTVTSAIIRVCEGEVLEVAVNGDPNVALETYFRIIDAKTAALMAACCQVGARVGGATPAVTESLAAFGMHLGLAFQIMDDVLDLDGDAERWGKPIGKDVKERRVTLPIIYTLQHSTPQERERICSLFRAEEVSEEEVDEVVGLVRRYGGLAAARTDACEQVRLSKACLASLAPSVAADALYAIADYAVSREQ